MRHALLLAVVVSTPGWLGAQTIPGQATSPSVTKAAESISAAEVMRHINVIAHDSMGGRDTPSRGLTKTAEYVMAEFKKLGLRPGGEISMRLDSTGNFFAGPDGQYVQDTSWFMKYPIPGNWKLDHQASQLAFSVKLRRGNKNVVNGDGWPIERNTALTFASTARFSVDTVPQSGARGNWDGIAPPRAFLVAGRHTPETIRKADIRDKVVLYIPARDAEPKLREQLVRQLNASNHVVVLTDEDSTTFTRLGQAALDRPIVVIDKPMEEALGVRRWAATVWPAAVDEFLMTGGVSVARTRADTTPIVREVPSLKVTLQPALAGKKDTATAMNVVAILDGKGPQYTRPGRNSPKWNEYLLYMAHMDGRGIARGQADSIYNGANDNASGLAGLLELARAFSQPDARPRRSIIFMGTSGGMKDFWGATSWAENYLNNVIVRTVVNLDMIGRKAGDSVTVDGLGDVDWPTRPDWIAGQHPELRLTVKNGGSISTSQSDHFAMVRRAMPTLYFYNGTHEDASTADTPDKIDAELEARILRLAYYLGYELGNVERPWTWTAAGRHQRVEVLGQ